MKTKSLIKRRWKSHQFLFFFFNNNGLSLNEKYDFKMECHVHNNIITVYWFIAVSYIILMSSLVILSISGVDIKGTIFRGRFQSIKDKIDVESNYFETTKFCKKFSNGMNHCNIHIKMKETSMKLKMLKIKLEKLYTPIICRQESCPQIGKCLMLNHCKAERST